MPILCHGQDPLANLPPKGDLKSKRHRTMFTEAQLERLEKEFQKQHHVVGVDRSEVADKINLSETVVKVWFQNTRIKWRKNNADAEISG